jgi:hypothetical protein
MSGHFIEKCKVCKKVIAQCRCPSENKEERWSICDECIEASKNEPYIKHETVVVEYSYNPKYGDERVCKCGHTYYRHFDTYENMNACGCKYCQCLVFEEAQKE